MVATPQPHARRMVGVDVASIMQQPYGFGGERPLPSPAAATLSRRSRTRSGTSSMSPSGPQDGCDPQLVPGLCVLQGGCAVPIGEVGVGSGVEQDADDLLVRPGAVAQDHRLQQGGPA